MNRKQFQKKKERERRVKKELLHKREINLRRESEYRKQELLDKEFSEKQKPIRKEISENLGELSD